jgi:hypothetical protein
LARFWRPNCRQRIEQLQTFILVRDAKSKKRDSHRVDHVPKLSDCEATFVIAIARQGLQLLLTVLPERTVISWADGDLNSSIELDSRGRAWNWPNAP